MLLMRESEPRCFQTAAWAHAHLNHVTHEVKLPGLASWTRMSAGPMPCDVTHVAALLTLCPSKAVDARLGWELELPVMLLWRGVDRGQIFWSWLGTLVCCGLNSQLLAQQAASIWALSSF